MQRDAFVCSQERSSGPQLPLKVAHLPEAGGAVGQGASEALTSYESISFVGRSSVVSVTFQRQGSLRPGAKLRRGCPWATVIPVSAGHTESWWLPAPARALVRGGAQAV